MGVYRARHIYLDEERAIKVVHSQFANEEAFVLRFIREAKMMSKLKHPNLVHLFEFGTLPDGAFFMVQEFIRGESLLKRVQRIGRIPIADGVRFFREAALGLQVAHEAEIVHRDISPDNILIVKDTTGSEIAKVIDFGIAKPLAEQTRIYTRTGTFLGKPEFCSGNTAL
jgi:serine/threonine-protein kinase